MPYKNHVRRNYFIDNNQRVNSNLEAGSNLEEYDVKNITCSIVDEEKLQDYIRLNDNGHESLLSDPSDGQKHISEPVSKLEFILCTVLFSRINLVLLAVIVNILLLLKLDNLFGQVMPPLA